MNSSMSYPQKMDIFSPPAYSCNEVTTARVRFPATSQTALTNPGNDIRIPIMGSFLLDAQKGLNLNLNLKISSATAPTIDFSLFNLFSEIRVEAGANSGQLLDQIYEPGHAHAMWSQYTWSQNDISVQNAKGLSMLQQPVVASSLLTKAGSTLAIGNADNLVTLDLSQVLGIFNTQALPLYDTQGITVICVMNTLTNGVAGVTNTPVWTINDVSITGTVIYAGDTYVKALRDKKSSSDVSIMCTSVNRSTINITGGGASGYNTLLVGDKRRSCLGYFATSRVTGDLVDGTNALYKNSCSLFPAWLSHQFSIGSKNYPQYILNQPGDAIDEAYDTMSHLSRSKYNGGGLLARTQAATAANDGAAGASATRNSITGQTHVLCVNLANCPADEAKQTFGTGLDTISNNATTYLNTTFTPAAVAYTINVYSIFQRMIMISKDGTMREVS